MRICITGGPNTGKTYLSKKMGGKVMHTDDLLNRGIDESRQSRMVADWFDHGGPWIIEGVTVPRALRKWLRHTTGKPCDKVIHLTRARLPLSKGQQVMAQGVNTVWREVLPQLRARGVAIEVRR